MQNTKLLAAVVVLQGLILMSHWTGQSPVTPAHAVIPDAGGQREAMVMELKALNSKVDRLVKTLESGKVQVQVASSDAKK